LQQFGIFSKHLSIDEQMVPYFGRHSIKMFIKGKPIRFGYKNWVLAASSGYPYKFETYMGSSKGSEKGKPLGPRVVLGLLSVVENPECHHVFFDNFFTSYGLLKSLKELKFKATGTVRENRIMKCPLQPSKIISMKERAFYDYRSDNNVMIVQWKDNRVVYMGSNTVGIGPIKKVKRYSQEAKMKIDVPQPACFTEYNKGMGGVDILDRFTSQY
jgi:DNA excision repair protein ERCC-6